MGKQNFSTIKKKAHSQTLNKWISIIEEEFDLQAEGERLTKQMEDLIEQLHDMVNGENTVKEIDKCIRRTAISWYKIGAKRGAKETIKALTENWLLDEESLEEMPENITWKAGLNYSTFERKKKLIPKKKYTIRLPE